MKPEKSDDLGVVNRIVFQQFSAKIMQTFGYLLRSFTPNKQMDYVTEAMDCCLSEFGRKQLLLTEANLSNAAHSKLHDITQY